MVIIWYFITISVRYVDPLFGYEVKSHVISKVNANCLNLKAKELCLFISEVRVGRFI